MLYGRRLDQALDHVDGSRYALVHAVSKRARQITLWLTADPAELRAEAAPPPAAGELVTRDPVALSEAEILAGEVRVRWDPDGIGEEGEDSPTGLSDIEDDTLLLEGLADDDDETDLGADDDAGLTPALTQVLEGEAGSGEEDDSEEGEDPEETIAGDEITDVSLEDLAEQEAEESDEEEEL